MSRPVTLPTYFKYSFTSVTRSLLIALGVVVIYCVAMMAISFWIMFSTVMTKRSPDGKHSATLTRIDGIDRMFEVAVDGRKVYTSDDFAPGPKDCREQIVWSTDADKVVLLVAGQRLFGYSVSERRSLSDSELLQVQFPSLKELGFEGPIPRASQEK